ncbi:MAG: ferredoxin [Bacillota bacterium]|jgi:NADH-quinone oxidoreductase subunit G/NADP-reducing hydrogenase subunit HndD|nr:MAG: ferredoxin [Bacillota bacterium]
MALVRVTIDGVAGEVDAGTTVLKAAEKLAIHIPTLCYLEGIHEVGACRVCVVEVKGAKTLQAACVTPVADGMTVRTNTPAVRKARKTVVELILSNHPAECPTCVRNTNCELQSLAESFNIRDNRFAGERGDYPVDSTAKGIVRDPNKCILCRRCVSVCEKVQAVKAIGPLNRGFDTVIAPAFGEPMGDSICVNCGQCVLVCPVGALYEQDHSQRVWAALADPSKHVVIQTAPATRVALGETQGMEPGSIVTGKMVAGLRRLGFDKVMDTDFTADLTIIEEGHELIERLTKGGVLPLITSCSPGWIKFIEHFYPELLPNVSTCKSPQQMFGALVKTYYAEKAGIDPADIFSVSMMPCTAKKFECDRPEMRASGHQDVDVVLTTREVGRMLREAGIVLETLPEEEHDAPMGSSTGAAVIFGATGGVMEAALRTAYEVVTGKTLPNLNFTAVRGLDGVKEAEVDLDGTKVRVAVAHALGNAKKVLDTVKAGQGGWHFIEIMCCPGGCLGGGGQPIPTNTDIRRKRMEAIYTADERAAIRKSHENPGIKAIYEEFLGKPLGRRSHELLHTLYTPRGRYGAPKSRAAD